MSITFISIAKKLKIVFLRKDETTSVTLKLDTVKEVRWATKYLSDLPEISDTMCLARNYHSVMNKKLYIRILFIKS